MTNRAREFRERAQSVWPGASVTVRGRNFIRHQHPTNPNKYMWDGLSNDTPIHIKNTTTEIDTALVASIVGNFTHEMTLADYNVYIRGDQFNAGDIFEFRDPISDEWVRFDPQVLNNIDEVGSQQQVALKQAVAGVVNDDTIVFPNAWGSGKHFRYQAQADKLQKLITIDNASDLPALADYLTGQVWLVADFSISFSAGVIPYFDGAPWDKKTKTTTSNRIEFRDAATGQQVFWVLDYPKAWDSNQENPSAVIGEMEIRKQGGGFYISVRIPYSWIETATFPIYIDPTVDVNVGASGDDGYWRTVAASYNNSGNYIYVGAAVVATWQYHAWYRFTGVTCEGTIDTADITLVANSYQGTLTDVLTKIYAEDADNPAAPTSAADAESRTPTTAGVDWDPTAWSGGTSYTSPDIKSVIQELVDTYTISGDAIQLLHKDDGTTSVNSNIIVKSYDFSSPEALHIEYTAASGTPIGLNSETDTAQAMSAAKTKAIGLNIETDSALGIGAVKTKSIGLIAETEQVFSLTVVKTVPLGLVTETETVFAFGKAKAKAIGLNTETDSALAMTATGATLLGLIVETDTVFAITPIKTRTLELVTETDQIFSLVASKTVLLGLVTETEAAFALGRAKAKIIGLSTETDLALAMVSAGATLLGLAVEIDTVFAMTVIKTLALGLVTETDSARAMVISQTGPTAERMHSKFFDEYFRQRKKLIKGQVSKNNRDIVL